MNGQARIVSQRVNQLIANIGKGALATLFPKDFDAYMMGIELCDSQDRTIDYFAFPVMPESITKSEPNRTNIKRTSSGVTILTSNSFTPEEITIKGNFGRSFKFYLSPVAPAVQGVAFSTMGGKHDLLSTKSNLIFGQATAFSIGIKTGYGAHSILRAIINKSSGVDATGQPFKLYFYNMALGESYLVTVPNSGFTSSQTMDKNMIWDYNLTLTVIAPLNALKSLRKRNSMLHLLTFSLIQQGVNAAAEAITTSIATS